MKHILLITVAIVAASTAAADVTWRLYDNNCPPRDSVNEFLCGDYGRFYVDDEDAFPGCSLQVAGSETPAPYFAVRNVVSFPVETPLPVKPGRAAAAPPPGDVGALIKPFTGTYRGAEPWLALIDFEGAHGLSVRWLAEAVAGPSIGAGSLLLDDPISNPDGNVTDLDVLRELCDVAQVMRETDNVMPIVNMSFGRALEANDPIGGQPCVTSALNCQIRRVAEHLHANDAVLIAAAGKQREWLFPAALDAVIGVGLLDPSEFVQSATSQPTWEMPAGTRALMPGNSLCLRGGWPAPSGASYSSAILSGWLAYAFANSPGLTLSSSATLKPHYSAARNCHVLRSGDGSELTGCNDYVEQLFAGLSGDFAPFCWDKAMPQSVSTTLGEGTLTQPETTAAVQWNAQVRPAPEGDPCVPCTGSSFALRGAGGGDLSINLSSTLAMRGELLIEGLYLRVDDVFYPLPLSADTLLQFRDGIVAQLIVRGAASIVSQAASASLFFRLRDSAADSCDDVVDGEPACAWVATHIHTL